MFNFCNIVIYNWGRGRDFKFFLSWTRLLLSVLIPMSFFVIPKSYMRLEAHPRQNNQWNWLQPFDPPQRHSKIPLSLGSHILMSLFCTKTNINLNKPLFSPKLLERGHHVRHQFFYQTTKIILKKLQVNFFSLHMSLIT